MRMLKGIKNSLIVDDSYNAAPLSMEAGLDSLKVFESQRKIVVLGDMLEIGKYAQEAHIKVGKQAAGVADLIFAVGTRSGFIAEGAISAGFDAGKIFQFLTADEAKTELQKAIKEKDVIFIKGSRSIKMEKITLEIMADPDMADKLLAK